MNVHFKGKNTEIGLMTMFQVETNISSSPLKYTKFLFNLVLKFTYAHVHLQIRNYTLNIKATH